MAAVVGKREQNKQANLHAILTAARECFLAQGYEGVSVRDVIRKTRLASGTFYNYFPDKESLFRALIEDHVRRLTERLIEVRRGAPTLDSFVEGAYRAAFSSIAQDPVLFNLLLRNEAVVRSFFQEGVMGMSVRALRSDIRDAIRRGVLPEMDVDFLAAAFFGTGYELGRVLAEDPGRKPEDAAAFAAKLFLRGIRDFRPQ